MSYGKMNTCVEIISTAPVKDAEGFVHKGDTVLASVRAYREGRHGNEKWANRASFTDATDLFRLRVIPNLHITPAMVIACEDGRFEIISVEDVKGRGMYVEALAREVKPSGKSTDSDA